MSHPGAPWGPFAPAGLAYQATPEDELRAQGQDPNVKAVWSIPETQWVTWGGEVRFPPVAPFNPNAPFQEVARIELPTPRACFSSFSGIGPATSVITFQVHQGVGRVELVREFDLVCSPTGNAVDPIFAGRIIRVLARESVNSNAGNAFIAQCVLSPIYPDPDMRRAGVPL